MSEFKADLHIHTNRSDGAKSPSSMISLAARANIAVASVTDHDTVLGINEAVEAGRECGVLVIPGVEISTGDREEIHILAYGVEPECEALLLMLQGSLSDRQQRILEMLEKLKALRMEIEPEEAFNKESDFAGRMNIALAMVSRGYVASTHEAFHRYLGINRPAFVPRKGLPPTDAIERLVSLGYVVSLAHPGRLLMGRDELSVRLPGFMEAGLSALEVYHPSHSEDDTRFYRAMANRNGLIITGGSDCHGRESRGCTQIGDHLRHWHTVHEDTERLTQEIKALRFSALTTKDDTTHGS